DFPLDELRLCWRKHAEAHIESYGVPCKPGLFELLDLLETRGVPKAVATSTRLERAHVLLDKLSLRHRFHTIIGGGEIRKRKAGPRNIPARRRTPRHQSAALCGVRRFGPGHSRRACGRYDSDIGARPCSAIRRRAPTRASHLQFARRGVRPFRLMRFHIN